MTASSKREKADDVRFFLFFFLMQFYQPAGEQVEIACNGGDVFAGSALIVNILDAGFQKIILIIMKNQMLFVQSGFFQKCGSASARKRQPNTDPKVPFYPLYVRLWCRE